jgi:predicted ATP-dependent serine protease
MGKKHIKKSVGKHKKQLYTGNCECGKKITVSSPKKQSKCWKCRGWNSHKQVVDIPKHLKKTSVSDPQELTIFQKILKSMKFKSNVVVITDEKK